MQGDDATRANRWSLFFVRILNRVRTLGRGIEQSAERDAETFDESRNFWHQNATFKTDVTAMLTSATGIKPFQAKRCS